MQHLTQPIPSSVYLFRSQGGNISADYLCLQIKGETTGGYVKRIGKASVTVSVCKSYGMEDYTLRFLKNNTTTLVNKTHGVSCVSMRKRVERREVVMCKGCHYDSIYCQCEEEIKKCLTSGCPNKEFEDGWCEECCAEADRAGGDE